MTAAAVVRALNARKWTLTTAESCTGGLLAAAITDIAGSSAVFNQGVVTYSNAAKMQLLGVRANTLSKYGAVSEDVAREMAQGAQHHANAQIAISITGIAGPGGSEFKPEGRVCFGLSWDGQAQTETRDFGPLGRAEVRRQSVIHALHLILTALG